MPILSKFTPAPGTHQSPFFASRHFISGILQQVVRCVWHLSSSMFSRSIHITAGISTSFLSWLSNIPSYSKLLHCADRPWIPQQTLVCFYLLAIVNHAAVNICVQVFESLFSNLWGHMVILHLTY